MAYRDRAKRCVVVVCGWLCEICGGEWQSANAILMVRLLRE